MRYSLTYHEIAMIKKKKKNCGVLYVLWYMNTAIIQYHGVIQSTHSFRQSCVTLTKTVEHFVKLVANDAIITHIYIFLASVSFLLFVLCFTSLLQFNKQTPKSNTD